MTWRRNSYRADTIVRFGQQAGLPLFEQSSGPLPDPIRTRFEGAPKSMQTGNDTRKLAHVGVTHNSVELGDRQQLVLDVIRDYGPVSNEEIARRLGWPINHVTGRTFELRQYGLVASAGKRKCSITGNIVHAWRAK